MLNKLEILKKGLDRANKNGIFTLEEASLLLTTYVQLKEYLEGGISEDVPPTKKQEKVNEK